MHIILLVLKIIGIIIASLLGIVLLLIGLILFVPIRYRAKAEKSEKLSVRFIGSWLLHLFHISICYEGENPVIKLRVVGIPLFDSTREKKEKKVKKKKKKKKKKKERSNESEELVQIMEIKPEEPDLEKEALSNGIEDKEIEKTMEQEESDFEKDTKEQVFYEKDEEQNSLWQKIKSWFTHLFDQFKRLKKIIRNFKRTFHKLWNKAMTVKEFITLDENKNGFSTVFGSFIQILKKIGPIVIKGKVHFGTGDPCSTGQALGVLSIFYGWFGRQVEIEPDFENQVLEGDLFIKGRFRMISLLVIGIRLLKDNKFKQLRKNIKQLKEEL